MPDLHSRIATEIDRRLAVARAATPGPWERIWAFSTHFVVPGPGVEGFTAGVNVSRLKPTQQADAEHIALNDPADSIRRLEAASRVLNRHRNDLGDCTTCCDQVDDEDSDGNRYSIPSTVSWPCADILDLAASLGLDTEGSTTDG